MKILLIGEYSGVHATLAAGLRCLGHEVVVLSNGDFWKDYPRDIDLVRTYSKWGGIRYMGRLLTLLPRLRGFDVVQLIGPMFLELKAERVLPVYKYLRRHNKKVILGANGIDWYWVHTCVCEKRLRYSDFNIGDTLRETKEAMGWRKEWLGTFRERMNRYMAETCDGIVPGLYEYWVGYQQAFPRKTRFIPYPIMPAETQAVPDEAAEDRPVRVFIGINKSRSAYKGTDIMLAAAKDIAEKYGRRVELRVVESVPYEEYQALMNHSDVVLDQLYSYTPAMNALLAMSKGIVCVGGGEPENYEILGETRLRPIVNVQPTYGSVYAELEQLVLHPERIPLLKKQSVEYVRRHHDYLAVARQYERFYREC